MSDDLSTGARLGGYELLSRIGRGGMASVWVARERTSGGIKQRLVAVKAMLPEIASRADFRSMFLEEGKLVGSIQHPNVVSVYEVAEDEGVLYMGMEWVEGASLRTIIKEAKRRRAIPAEMAVRMIADTAAGLHAAHELKGYDGKPRGVVHCDVSPHNILIGLDGNAKLVDFGVAHATAQSKLDGPEQIKGKVGYMSPEQAQGKRIDRRSDIFSLGIVLFELTTGERLFRGENLAHTLQLVTEGKVPRPRDVHAAYPKELEAIVLKALEHNVENRYQTADGFRKALESYLIEKRVVVPRSGVANLLKRVVGARMEEQRDNIRAALLAVDGAVERGLVPEQPATVSQSGRALTGSNTGSFANPLATDPLLQSHSGVSHAGLSGSFASLSLSRGEPPPSSTFSQTDGTPGPLVVAPRPSRGSLAFAAFGVLSALLATIWAMQRPAATAPLAAASSATAVARGPASSADAKRSVHTETERGVSLDALPLEGNPAVGTAPLGGSSRASKSNKVTLVDELVDAPKDPAVVKDQGVAAPERGKLPPLSERPPLNRSAALTALSSASMRAGSCRASGGPSGRGTVSVTFSPDGYVQNATVSPPFAGTSVGACVTRLFKSAHIPAYNGASVMLGSGFTIAK